MWRFALEKKTGWGRERANQKPACRDKLESWLKKNLQIRFSGSSGEHSEATQWWRQHCIWAGGMLRRWAGSKAPFSYNFSMLEFLPFSWAAHWLTSSGGIPEVRGVGGGLFACLFNFKDFIYFHLFGVLWKLNLSLKYFCCLSFLVFRELSNICKSGGKKAW